MARPRPCHTTTNAPTGPWGVTPQEKVRTAFHIVLRTCLCGYLAPKRWRNFPRVCTFSESSFGTFLDRNGRLFNAVDPSVLEASALMVGQCPAFTSAQPS